MQFGRREVIKTVGATGAGLAMAFMADVGKAEQSKKKRKKSGAATDGQWDISDRSNFDGYRFTTPQQFMQDRRPDLNGLCLTEEPWGTGPVFLVDKGVVRGLTNEAFLNLFGTNPHRTSGQPGYVLAYADIAKIPGGPDVQHDAFLCQCSDPVTPVFLIDNGKRGFPSADRFNLYNLAWSKIDTSIKWAVLQYVPPGDSIDGRP